MDCPLRLEDSLKIAVEASELAASIINRALDRRHGSEIQFDEKSSTADLVTKYDKECESTIIKFLQTATPKYLIVSEETKNAELITNEPTWVVDPIDGTMSFVHGMIDCCVSIGLLINREPVVGVVNAPRLHEIFTAVKGRGAFLNGKRISVSPISSLNNAIVLSHYCSRRTKEAVNSMINIHRELNLFPVHSVRCHGSGALDICFVAAGRAEVYFDTETHPWDVAAASVIIREAGGVIHDIDNTSSFDIASRGMCCGNGVAMTMAIVTLLTKHKYKEHVLAKL